MLVIDLGYFAPEDTSSWTQSYISQQKTEYMRAVTTQAQS